MARAAATWGAVRACATSPRVRRANAARYGSANASAGSNTWRGDSNPPAGSQPSVTANTRASSGATTMGGRANPAVAAKVSARSSRRPGESPATAPAATPSPAANASAKPPTVRLTGKPLAMSSFTVKSLLRNEGPKSPWQSISK